MTTVREALSLIRWAMTEDTVDRAAVLETVATIETALGDLLETETKG